MNNNPIKLIFSKNLNNTWNKLIIDLFLNEVVLERSGIPFDENIHTIEYFNNIITRYYKSYNIVEIERFI